MDTVKPYILLSTCRTAKSSMLQFCFCILKIVKFWHANSEKIIHLTKCIKKRHTRIESMTNRKNIFKKFTIFAEINL